MNYIGVDKNNKKLKVGDICNFKLRDTQYEGMIVYDDEYFCYAFEMKDDRFPMLLMFNADDQSIERIINVTETKSNDEYSFYRKIYKIKE